MERICASADALDDCLTFPMLVEWILAASHKPARNCNPDCIEERWGRGIQVEEALVDGVRGGGGISAGKGMSRGYRVGFFGILGRARKRPAGFKEFFSVSGGRS